MAENLRTITVSVRNVLGVRAADLTVAPGEIALVGGLNAAGKSSLLEAIAACVRGTHAARGVTTKKDAAALVHEGESIGSVSLDYEDGAVRVVWPEATTAQSGRPIPLGSDIGIGVRPISDMTAKERMAELAPRLRIEPTREELVAWFDTHVPQADRPSIAVIDKLWEVIDTSGWDAAYAKAKQTGTELTGEWRGITGEMWGEKKAATWTPPMLVPGEAYDLEAEQALLREAQNALEKKLGAAAVSAERQAEARRIEQEMPYLERAAAEADAAATAALAELEGLLQGSVVTDGADPTGARAIITGEHGPAPCPACKTPLTARIAPDGDLHLLGYDPASAKAIRAAQEARKNQTAALKVAEAKAKTAQQVAARALADLDAARRLAAEVAKALSAGVPTEEELEALRAEVARRQARVAAIEKGIKAKACYRKWRLNDVLTQALAPAPAGVRGWVAGARIEAFQEELATLAAHAKWPTPSVDVTGEMTMGGRAIGLCSESERWRANLIIAAALARRERACILLVDRMDVLVKQQRPGVFHLLRHIGIPAICAISMPDPESMPNLAAAGYGATYWMEKGVLRPFGK